MRNVRPSASRHHCARPPYQATNKAGYRQSKITPGYWQHNWRPISFTLVVDDFGVKYVNKDDVGHLISSLCWKKRYQLSSKSS